MLSLLRLERKQTNYSNPFRIRIVVFLSNSFEIETINTFIHSTVPWKTITRIQTKMSKMYTRFRTKTAQEPRGGGYSIYPWVGRCGVAPHTLTLFKTNIADFPTRFLIPCLRHLINIRAWKNFAVYRPRKDILFKTKIDKSIPWLRQKMIISIPCLRQKSRKTYPGWPHVPIKPL